MNGIVFATFGLLFSVAAQAYLLGCVNGAILASRLFFHDDVRKHGSGNAGLTNFYRTYGAKYALVVIFFDMGKAALGVLIGGAVLAYYLGWGIVGRYFAAFFCVLGHLLPAFYEFRGGKGILCSATLLLCLDWRIAAVCWALFFVLWLTTRYVSLGSVAAALAFPLMTAMIYQDVYLLLAALGIAAMVLWAHRENIARLLHGTENKFHFHIKPSEDKE